MRGVESIDIYESFSSEVISSMLELRAWVSSQPEGSVVGFGAAAKTVTTFHAANLDQTKFSFIADSNRLKQGRRLPGTSIPIESPEYIREGAPSVLIFPWNIHVELLQYIQHLNPKAKVWVHNPLKSLN